jgi:predicted RNA binding protein YcfA (HicA-like mRNA interferase family)
MPRVPRVTGEEAVRAFGKVGFYHARTKGSHVVLKRDGHRFLLTIPMHKGKTIGIGLLKAQIDAAGLSVEEFIELL